MIKGKNELKISIEYAIREYKKCRNEEYLGYLLKSLKNEPLLITVKPSDEVRISEISETSIPIVSFDDIPTIVASGGNKFWISSFTGKDKIPVSFLENNVVVEVRLKDLIDKSLNIENVEGISINHKSDTSINISNEILKGVDLLIKEGLL